MLDGYPKNYNNADHVFMHRPKKEEKKAAVDDDGNPVEEAGDPEEEAKQLKATIFKHIYPESVISLRASDQYIKKMAKRSQLNKTIDSTKWEGDRLNIKMNKYNSENAIALFKQKATNPTNVYPTAKFF